MIDTILGIVSKFIPDSSEAEKTARLLEQEFTKQMELKASIIKQESQLGGWAARWRPMTAITFVFMVFVHWLLYDVAPWIVVTFDLNVWTPQDPGYTDGLLDLIKVCLMGYIGSRSIEKGISIWRR